MQVTVAIVGAILGPIALMLFGLGLQQWSRRKRCANRLRTGNGASSVARNAAK